MGGNKAASSAASPGSDKAGKLFSWEEVARHRKPDDAWLVIRNKVYDISGWTAHPGGDVIMTHAGVDATDNFSSFHPASAHSELKKFLIGRVEDEKDEAAQAQKAFEQEYRALRSTFITRGLFKTNHLYYVWKVLSTVAIAAASIAIALVYHGNLLATIVAALIMGLFWQQTGWLAHDYLHHQVFDSRFANDMMGILVGNVMQGFSVAWWKNKHNRHHAVPNLHESAPGASDGDPDIDTMPFLAWSGYYARKALSGGKLEKLMVRYQAFYYFPLLALARLSWMAQSYSYVFKLSSGWDVKTLARTDAPVKYGYAEHAGLIVHYAWVLYFLAQLPLAHAVLFLFLAEATTGFLLALVFGVGHNGMAVYDDDERPDFWRFQVSTTRNIDQSFFNDWFTGGLNYQIEHHLFTGMPRHHLAEAKPLVMSLCKKHGIRYHCTSLPTATIEVLSHLDEVAREFVKEFPAM